MNLMSLLTLMSLITLTIPIFLTMTKLYESDKYPNCVKTSIMCALAFCLLPTLMFINSNYELIISNWHWMTIKKLT